MIGILSGDYVVARLLAILPELETVTLYPMASSGSYGAGVSWTAKREPASAADLWMAGLESTDKGIKFTMLDTTGSMTPPANEDKITDAASASWAVKSVDTDQFKRVHHVTCTRMI